MPRRPSSDSSTRLEAIILRALADAKDLQRRVRVVVRGNASAGVPPRVFEGVPVTMRPAADGRMRLVLAVSEDSEQLVLIERIVMVTPAPEE